MPGNYSSSRGYPRDPRRSGENFAGFGVNIIGAGKNFNGDKKKRMLVAAMRLVERQLIRWPYIQGIRGQLLTYKLAEDNKLPQDIVVVLMMAAYFLRMYQWEEYAEGHQPETPVVATPAHDARNVVLTPRTAGLYLPG